MNPKTAAEVNLLLSELAALLDAEADFGTFARLRRAENGMRLLLMICQMQQDQQDRLAAELDATRDTGARNVER